MRSVVEWVGKGDDSATPPRVKVRIFEKHGGLCAICSRRIGGNIRPAFDHVIALINGGENRESNIQLLCEECHLKKTGADVKVKAKSARIRMKRMGIKKSGRRMPGSKGSGIRRRMDGTVWRE